MRWYMTPQCFWCHQRSNSLQTSQSPHHHSVAVILYLNPVSEYRTGKLACPKPSVGKPVSKFCPNNLIAVWSLVWLEFNTRCFFVNWSSSQLGTQICGSFMWQQIKSLLWWESWSQSRAQIRWLIMQILIVYPQIQNYAQCILKFTICFIPVDRCNL